jgi:hypothetical protein
MACHRAPTALPGGHAPLPRAGVRAWPAGRSWASLVSCGCRGLLVRRSSKDPGQPSGSRRGARCRADAGGVDSGRRRPWAGRQQTLHRFAVISATWNRSPAQLRNVAPDLCAQYRRPRHASRHAGADRNGTTSRARTHTYGTIFPNTARAVAASACLPGGRPHNNKPKRVRRPCRAARPPSNLP